MMKTNKIFLGLSTLIVAGLLSPAIQSYAYEKKKITIHPVNALGEQIHNNIEIEADVVKDSSNPDDWYYSFKSPEIEGYHALPNYIEKLSKFKADNITITISYTSLDSGASKKNWACVNGNWYYRNADGVYSYAWEKINDSWYFFDIETAAMKTDCWVRWNNKWYYIKSDGTMATNTYIGGYYVDANGEWVG